MPLHPPGTYQNHRRGAALDRGGLRHNVGGKFLGSDFLSVRNRQFERHGQPYRYLGVNFPDAVKLAASDKPEDRAQLLRELDLLRSFVITNLRVLAGSEGPAADGKDRQVLRPGPNEWNEAMLQGMDFLLAEMARRDLTGVF